MSSPVIELAQIIADALILEGVMLACFKDRIYWGQECRQPRGSCRRRDLEDVAMRGRANTLSTANDVGTCELGGAYCGWCGKFPARCPTKT